MKVSTASRDRRWPNGEVPLVVPGVWAANDRLLRRVDQAIDALNLALRGHVEIRARRAGDRDYLRLHVSTQVVTPGVQNMGRHGGAQNLNCRVQSLTDPSPSSGALIRELCRALGVHQDFLSVDQHDLSPCVIEALKRVYPKGA